MIRFEPKPSRQCAMAAARAALIARMADDMRTIAFSGQGCTERDLMDRGYSAAAIKRFGQAAINRARRASITRVA
jgi:hypothetical protein